MAQDGTLTSKLKVSKLAIFSMLKLHFQVLLMLLKVITVTQHSLLFEIRGRLNCTSTVQYYIHGGSILVNHILQKAEAFNKIGLARPILRRLKMMHFNF